MEKKGTGKKSQLCEDVKQMTSNSKLLQRVFCTTHDAMQCDQEMKK
jgi:hypothetical protein